MQTRDVFRTLLDFSFPETSPGGAEGLGLCIPKLRKPVWCAQFLWLLAFQHYKNHYDLRDSIRRMCENIVECVRSTRRMRENAIERV